MFCSLLSLARQRFLCWKATLKAHRGPHGNRGVIPLCPFIKDVAFTSGSTIPFLPERAEMPELRPHHEDVQRTTPRRYLSAFRSYDSECQVKIFTPPSLLMSILPIGLRGSGASGLSSLGAVSPTTPNKPALATCTLLRRRLGSSQLDVPGDTSSLRIGSNTTGASGLSSRCNGQLLECCRRRTALYGQDMMVMNMMLPSTREST